MAKLIAPSPEKNYFGGEYRRIPIDNAEKPPA